MRKVMALLVALSLFSGGCFFSASVSTTHPSDCKYVVTTYADGLVCEETWCFDYVVGQWYLHDEWCYY